jgi:GMP synthase (glutamine-hydrolysing)
MDKIAVLDFGGQYAHLIANRVRRLNVYSEIFDAATPAAKLRGFKGVILSGGPQSVYDKDAIKCDPGILELGVPLLGICYGHQLLAYLQGAKVEPADYREYGLTQIKVLKKEGVFKGLADLERVWMSHGDSVKNLPPGYEVIGQSPGEYAAIANFAKNFYGFQFHLEVSHTKSGMKMLDNFLSICGVKKEWKIDNFIEEEIERARALIGDKKVFMLVSGGVDSTVAFALLGRALGPDRVYGLFVDTGFLRFNEREQVEKSLKSLGFDNLHVKDASADFFSALKEVYEPEKKRQIIGELFLKVQAEVVASLGLNPDEWLIGQGTIYPDTIESGGTKNSAKIKTHHNRVSKIEEMIKQGRIIEPLAQLYKDEVRAVGEKLGLPAEIVWRHPFPGPGLAVRCLCAKQANWPEGFRQLEARLNADVAKHGLTARILPVQSVGVQGDFRTYRHPVALIGDSDFVILDAVATDLINRYTEINRVLWLKAPASIAETDTVSTEQTKMGQVSRNGGLAVTDSYLTRERIALLQKADKIVSQFIEEKGISRQIWQFPTVLVPLSVQGSARGAGESIVLRPVESDEAMTANFYRMDLKLLDELIQRLVKIPGISAVFYDVTNKPPGTIEWE